MYITVGLSDLEDENIHGDFTCKGFRALERRIAHASRTKTDSKIHFQTICALKRRISLELSRFMNQKYAFGFLRFWISCLRKSKIHVFIQFVYEGE